MAPCDSMAKIRELEAKVERLEATSARYATDLDIRKRHLQALRSDTARLDWIESECADLRCHVHQYQDDSDTYYQVVTFHMDAPKERCVGEASDPRKAIDMAMAGTVQPDIKVLERSEKALNAPEQQESAEIVQRLHSRRELQREGCPITSVSADDDIDTLLQGLRHYSNAHKILLAQRDEARAERDQLKAAKLQHDSEQRAAALALRDERIERLEGAINQSIKLIDEFEVRTSTAWPSTVKVTNLLQSALAASQQHTAGSGERNSGGTPE